MNDLTRLAEGFAYCEVKGVYDKAYDKDPTAQKYPLVDRNGAPMIAIHWSVVDKDATVGIVKAYISSKLQNVIANLENALGIKYLFNEKTKQFNISLLLNRACAAVLKLDDKYGSKIEKYVPMEFFNFLTHKTESVNATPAEYRNPTDARSHIPTSSNNDYDDIPF